MQRFNRSTYSHCQLCPLNTKRRVWGEYPDTGDVDIVFVGEAPGAQENYQGRPFVGGAGIWLNKALAKAGILRFRSGVTNIISCQPPGNNINSFEAHEARKYCKKGLEAEVKYWKQRHVKVIVPLGNTALEFFNIPYRIGEARGSVFKWKDFVVVPTYHPAYIMRGQIKEEGTWVADLMKAKEIADKGWEQPEENFIIEPTVNDVRNFVEKAIKRKALIGVDVETTGLNPYKSSIVVIGLALSGSEALSVPFLTTGGLYYWDSSSEPVVRSLVDRLFRTCPLLFQNALYDVRHLRIAGFTLNNIEHDVLLAHHTVHPELPHNLAYITSIYGKTPYWKAPFKERTVSILDMDQRTLRVYNLRDAVVLHQILPGLIDDLKELGTYKIYKNITMRLIHPVMEMMDTGLKISSTRLRTWRNKLKAQLEEIESKLREVGDLPEEFNFSSGDQVRYLLYGQIPNQFKKAIKEKEKIDKSKNPKRKLTKKYKELKRIVTVFNETTPLLLPSMIRPTTKKGGLAIDGEARLRIRLAVTKRLREIDNLKKPEAKQKETNNLEKTLQFLELYDKYQEVMKLWSTYTNFPTEEDGRVHFPYKIHGTATGRLASGDKSGLGVGNAQNIPEEARNIFVAEDNHVFIAGDYINLELVLIALLSKDEVLLDIFRYGKNAHDENTRMLFGIDKDHPQWKTYRKAAKVYRFAMNYGSTIESAYRNVVLNVPEFKMSLAEFREMDRKYMELHPAYKNWYESVKDTVVKTRMLKNGFGRVRIFLGNQHEIIKQALDFGPQSTGADIVSEALIDVWQM
ncbi:MAG: DNA polymerase, partial [Caldisphaeraceae archaeon]|nr:DNA polymerase [Caldisphaeraceae archaeon]